MVPQEDQAGVVTKKVKIYDIEKQADGSIKIVSELTAEETKFMLEFALNNLYAFGFVPKSLEKYFSKEEQERELLESIPTEELTKQ